MRIIGIDPGSSRIGYGVIDDGSTPKLVRYGTIEIPKGMPTPEKFILLRDELRKIIQETSPEAAAVETLYFSKNQKTAIHVAEARGVILLTLAEANIPIHEYGPNQVKLSVTGHGSTDKKGVQKMVKTILRLQALDGYDDASDALAIALAAGRHI